MTVAWIGRSTPVAIALVVFLAAPSGSVRQSAGRPSRPDAPLAELWVDPGDVGRRDALHGPGGRAGAPRPDAVYEVVDLDTTGYSGGYTVTDAQGRRWDVKIGREAQTEVVASRVLWLVGYHQPVVHFLTSWRRKGEEHRPEVSGRFRLQSDHEAEGEWGWRDNPFVGTRALNGLVVVNLVLNNWDFKTSNNRVYTIERTTRAPARWFVVQDLGASLGRTGWPVGTRNDVDAFERQRLLKDDDGVLTFDYGGRHREVLEDLTAADIRWACRLLDRITDRQWADIFRAAAYPADVATRYRTHLLAKIAEGVALDPGARVQP